jgi:hypothetical protein
MDPFMLFVSLKVWMTIDKNMNSTINILVFNMNEWLNNYGSFFPLSMTQRGRMTAVQIKIIDPGFIDSHTIIEKSLKDEKSLSPLSNSL